MTKQEKLEEAKNILERELRDGNNPHSFIDKDCLWRKPYTDRRIKSYVIASHKASIPIEECKDWFINLLWEFGINDEYKKCTSSYSNDIANIYDVLDRI